MGKLLWDWGRGRGNGEEYKKGKREYKAMCRRKREEKSEELMRVVRTKKEVWKVINRERWRKVRVTNEIEKEECVWDEYFKGILGDSERRIEVDLREESEGKGEGSRGEGLEWEEVEDVIRRLKKRKAAGEDGVQNEVWISGGKEIRKTLWDLCRKVWEGEGLPARWRDGVIVPVAEKRGAERVEDHREVTLMLSACKRQCWQGN